MSLNHRGTQRCAEEKYKAYPEYKDSGVEWLNEIPSHWNMSKLRYIGSFGKGLTITKENLSDTGVPCVNYGEVHSKYGFEVDAEIHPLKCVDEKYLETSPNALLSKGDLIFADTSEDIEGSGNFTQLVGKQSVFAGYHTVVIRPDKENNDRFLAYVLDSLEYRTQVRTAVKGVKVFSVTQAILRNTNVWLPSLNEQKQIAAFLDRETAKIDTLIDKQKKLIALLKEKRQATISHAVTKGLNPNSPMKDSGIPWLGKVPAHWEMSKMRYMFSFDKGLTVTKSDLLDEGVPCVNYGEVHSKYGFEVDPVKHPLKCVDSSYLKNGNGSLLSQGDLIFADTSEDIEGSGNFTQSISDQVIFAGYHTIIARPNDRECTRFYAYLTDSIEFRTQIRKAVKGVKVFSITQAILRNSDVWLPSITEQKQIAEFLDMKTVKIDELISKSEQAIELIQERRTALISAAVTGKINVRDPVLERERV